MKKGTLFGIGVGPGDPELITLRAVRMLGAVDVVFAAASSRNNHSQAVEIARPHLRKDAPVALLPFPMTKNSGELAQAWEANAREILSALERGLDAAFLTLGDCMTYSTFGYLMKSVRRLAPGARIVSIPGITSYQAAACCLNTPLVEGEESLLLVSGVNGGGRYREMAFGAENVVFLKAYKNAGDIALALDETGRAPFSVGVARCGLSGQQVIRDVGEFKEKPPDYWTLIIAKKGSGNGAQEG